MVTVIEGANRYASTEAESKRIRKVLLSTFDKREEETPSFSHFWDQHREAETRRAFLLGWSCHGGDHSCRSMPQMQSPQQTSDLDPPHDRSRIPESLRDGREIWLYGERVEDVTTHPAFRNTARMIARLYDALHDPTMQDVLTTETDTGSGGYTHRYFRAPMSWRSSSPGATPSPPGRA